MVSAGSITVAVRVRPPTAWESARLPIQTCDSILRGDGALSSPTKLVNNAPLRDIVRVIDDRILTFDPDEKDQVRSFVERGFLPPGTKRYKDKRFMFDKVFDHEARQQDVYDATAEPLIKGLFDGYNATVFAYGATGCGKTHTISGTESDPGIIYLTMADLFQRIEDRRQDWHVDVRVTFLEIYNEEIRDLLAEPGSHMPRGGLSIREDKSVKVVGLVELQPKSAEEVKEIVLQGNLRRTQSPTHANETSSRSHAVLQVHLMQAPRTAALTEQRTMATLSIIDLAGSERAAATTNMGQRMIEGANINKSLLALGNCINALCESGGATRHVPYRNSKLTRLLKFSLGGNCKTVMIVCVAPTSNHFDDTHNTLVYAERATRIKTKVVTRNVLNVDRHVGQYVEAINRLNAEILELKAKISGKRDLEEEIARRKRVEALSEIERAKSTIHSRMEQTKETILDGAACSGTIAIVNAKLNAIRTRLVHDAGTAPLSADLEAERTLLQAFALPEEQAIKPGSFLMTRLQRASNFTAMFDATLRAVSERKSEKLSESDVANIKLDAAYRKAEVEKWKAEGERKVMLDAVGSMAEMLAQLIATLGRCTFMVGEAADTLDSTIVNEAGLTSPEVTKKVSNSLKILKKNNDETLQNVLGASTDRNRSLIEARNRALNASDDYEACATRRICSSPAIMKQHADVSLNPRRSSSFGVHLQAPIGARRLSRSPRKSLRSSLTSQPYRRISDKERISKGAKNVQWRDEVGQGALAELGPKSLSVAVEIIPPSPDTKNTVASITSDPLLSNRCTSFGSENEWEDENDNNISISLSSDNATLTGSGTDSNRRFRSSRLDPGFLKCRAKAITLESLTEDDEPDSPRKHDHDLLKVVNLNHLDKHLQIPKSREHVPGSPSRRSPSTPGKNVVMKTTGTRRRSNVGPLRSEKSRRRSSLIPQLSPNEIGSGPRRIVVASPAKRVKRTSLTKSKYKFPPVGSNGSISCLMTMDPNSSADSNLIKVTKKATWR